MWALDTIIEMNRKSPVTVETNHNRNCSFSGTVEEGIVLHSARQRSTRFIQGAVAKQFMAGWLGTNSQTRRNQLVESYFAS